MPDFDYIGYEVIDEGRIAVITLDRPKQRNAQNRGMLVELGSAFELAEMDDEVRVVLLRAAGSSFSAGHDLGSMLNNSAFVGSFALSAAYDQAAFDAAVASWLSSNGDDNPYFQGTLRVLYLLAAAGKFPSTL